MISNKYRDAVIIFIVCLIIAAVGLHFDLAELIGDFIVRNKHWGLDRLLLIVAIFSIGLGSFCGRKIYFLRQEATDRQTIEIALKESEQYSRVLFQTMQTGLVVIDKETRTIIDVNPAALVMIGTEQEKIIGRECHLHICPKERGQCPIADLGQTIDQSERVLLRADGTQIPVLKSVIFTKMGGHEFLVETLTDLTERKALEKKLKEISITDELTGILNRRGFLELAEKQKLLAERLKCEIHIIYADIDNMKWINDVLGHETGDLAIAEAAQLLGESLRKSDLIGYNFIGSGRLGGDEFAILLTSVTPVKGEHPALERLRQRLARINDKPDRKYTLEISFGEARSTPETPCTLDELFAQADQKMYESKRLRKNTP